VTGYGLGRREHDRSKQNTAG